MKEWFNKYILDVLRDENGDCERIILLGIYIDFRQYYYRKLDVSDYNNEWFNEEYVQKVRRDEENKNKRRKNKLPLTEFVKVPWYKTILNWNKIRNHVRNILIVFNSFVLGVIVGKIWDNIGG